MQAGGQHTFAMARSLLAPLAPLCHCNQLQASRQAAPTHLAVQDEGAAGRAGRAGNTAERAASRGGAEQRAASKRRAAAAATSHSGSSKTNTQPTQPQINSLLVHLIVGRAGAPPDVVLARRLLDHALVPGRRGPQEGLCVPQAGAQRTSNASRHARELHATAGLQRLTWGSAPSWRPTAWPGRPRRQCGWRARA